MKSKQTEKERESTYSITLEIDLLKVDPNNTRGMHWTKIRKPYGQIKKEIYLQSRGKTPKKPLENFKVSIVRHAIKEMDWDNLVASLKAPIDGLHRSAIIRNDSWKFIKHIDIDQVKSKTERKLVIKVEGFDE